MLVILAVLVLAAALGVGAPVWVLSWELRNGRTIPPIRVERVKHPRWYWLCILTHAVFLVFMVLLCGALLLLGLISAIKMS